MKDSFHFFIYSYLYTIPYQHNKVNIDINSIKKKKLLFQGVVFVSLYPKNSLNLTLKELNEAESRICFGISFQALAPWYPKEVSLSQSNPCLHGIMGYPKKLCPVCFCCVGFAVSVFSDFWIRSVTL